MRITLLRTKISALILSIGLSFCLWLVIAGQNMTAVDLNVPLELVGLPENLIIKSDLPTSVTFHVLANTAQIKFLNDRKPQMNLDVSSAKEGLNTFPLLPERVELPRGVQIRKINPDLVVFEVDKLISKTVPVKPVTIGSVTEGFRVKSTTVSPNVVTLRGPAQYIESIESVSTIPVDLSGLTKITTLDTRLSTANLGPSIALKPAEFKIRADIEQIMTQQVFKELPIKINNNDEFVDEADFKISPGSVQVTLAWPEADKLNINNKDILAYVNGGLQPVEYGKKTFFPVIIIPPEKTSVIAIDPVTIALELKNPPPQPTALPGSPEESQN